MLGHSGHIQRAVQKEKKDFGFVMGDVSDLYILGFVRESIATHGLGLEVEGKSSLRKEDASIKGAQRFRPPA